MFTETGVNSLASTDGFAVRRRSRSELEYKTDNKTVVIEVEPGDALAIYISSVRKWDSEGGEIGPVQRDQIAKNVAAAMNFWRLEYVFV